MMRILVWATIAIVVSVFWFLPLSQAFVRLNRRWTITTKGCCTCRSVDLRSLPVKTLWAHSSCCRIPTIINGDIVRLCSSHRITNECVDHNSTHRDWPSCADDATASTPPAPPTQPPLTHRDVVWRLCPSPNHTTAWERIMWQIQVLAQQALIQASPPHRSSSGRKTTVAVTKKMQLASWMIPPGEQILLHAYDARRHCNDDYQQHSKELSPSMSPLGRFGLTTRPGPPALPIQETVLNDLGWLSNSSSNSHTNHQPQVRSAAIIFMVVEPAYRGRGLGALALDVIRYLHYVQGCHVTLLVADDKSPPNERKLVRWYEHHGFVQAPKLQDLLGSPNCLHGIAMIAQTISKLPDDCVIQCGAGGYNTTATAAI